MNKILIIGAGGHGKVVCDIAKTLYKEVVFADDQKVGQEILSCPVICTVEDACKMEPCDFVVAIGGNKNREKLFYMFLNAGFKPVNLIHKSAVIGEGVEIGVGSVVFANAVINPDTKIGFGCIINTCASVDHDCTIGDFSHVCPSSHLAGTVVVGKNCTFGIGSSVINNVNICSDVFVGAGGVVVKDITKSGTYVGVPARLK